MKSKKGFANARQFFLSQEMKGLIKEKMRLLFQCRFEKRFPLLQKISKKVKMKEIFAVDLLSHFFVWTCSSFVKWLFRWIKECSMEIFKRPYFFKMRSSDSTISMMKSFCESFFFQPDCNTQPCSACGKVKCAKSKSFYSIVIDFLRLNT